MKTTFLVIPAFLGALALNTGVSLAQPCSGGHIQHAKILGVDPTLFTEGELISLANAMDEGDTFAVSWIKERNEQPEVSRGVTTYCEML